MKCFVPRFLAPSKLLEDIADALNWNQQDVLNLLRQYQQDWIEMKADQGEASARWMYKRLLRQADVLGLEQPRVFPDGKLVESLTEGDGQPGFDLPLVYKVSFERTRDYPDESVWYVEVEPRSSRKWIINRAAAAALKADKKKINHNTIGELLRKRPPTLTNVSNRSVGGPYISL